MARWCVARRVAVRRAHALPKGWAAAPSLDLRRSATAGAAPSSPAPQPQVGCEQRALQGAAIFGNEFRYKEHAGFGPAGSGPDMRHARRRRLGVQLDLGGGRHRRRPPFIAEHSVYALYISGDLLPFAGESGRENIKVALHRMRADYEYLLYRPLDLMAKGDEVRYQVEFMYRHRRSGGLLSGRFRMIMRVEDGLIVRDRRISRPRQGRGVPAPVLRGSIDNGAHGPERRLSLSRARRGGGDARGGAAPAQQRAPPWPPSRCATSARGAPPCNPRSFQLGEHGGYRLRRLRDGCRGTDDPARRLVSRPFVRRWPRLSRARVCASRMN